MDSCYLYQVVLKLFRCMDRKTYRAALTPSVGRFCWDDERTYRNSPFEKDLCEIGVSALMNVVAGTGVGHVRISGGIHHNELDMRDHITLYLYRLEPGRHGEVKHVFQGTAHLVYNENLEVFDIDETMIGVRGELLSIKEYVNIFSV